MLGDRFKFGDAASLIHRLALYFHPFQDSMGNFYDCRLTLTPAHDPVACPSGFIFSREAIIENLLAQKKENKRRLVAWEAAQADTARKESEREAVDKEAS